MYFIYCPTLFQQLLFSNPENYDNIKNSCNTSLKGNNADSKAMVPATHPGVFVDPEVIKKLNFTKKELALIIDKLKLKAPISKPLSEVSLRLSLIFQFVYVITWGMCVLYTIIIFPCR